MNKPTEFTVIPGLFTPVNSEHLVELNSDSTPGGDWYSLLRNVEFPLYYVALNGQIFLVTYSDATAYNTFYQATGKPARVHGRFTIAALEAAMEHTESMEDSRITVRE